MPIIGSLTKSDSNVGFQDFIYDNGQCFLGNSVDPNSWKPLTLEQVYKLDKAGALSWNNANHRLQILTHYSRISGVPLESDSSRGVVSVAGVVPKENVAGKFFGALFRNRFVKLFLILIPALLLVWGVWAGISYFSYSSNINSGDAVILLDKYKTVFDANASTFSDFSARFDMPSNNSSVYQGALTQTIQQVTANTETAVDIEGMINSALESSGTVATIFGTVQAPDTQKIRDELSAITAKPNAYGISGPRRLLSYVLFKDFTFKNEEQYSDPEIEDSTYASLILNRISNSLSALENIRNIAVDKKMLGTLDSSGKFSYPIPTDASQTLATAVMQADFTISKNRASGPRFAGIEIKMRSAEVK